MAKNTKQPISVHGQAEDKKKALETAIAQIEKNYGKGAIMRLGEDIHTNVAALSNDRRGTEERRHRGLYRRGACPGPGLRQEYRR